MNYGNFLQFNSWPDWFSQARMVYRETPPAAPPASEEAAAAAERTKDEAAAPDAKAAAERQAALREQSAKARKAGEKERKATTKEADASLQRALDADGTPAAPEGTAREETADENIPAAAPAAGSEAADEQIETETANPIPASEANVRALMQKYEKLRGTRSDEEITNTVAKDPAMQADFAIIHWAEQPIAAAEIDAALAKAREELKSAWESASPAVAADSLPTPEEINSLAASGKLDFREAKALREHLKKQIEDGENLPRLTGDALEEFKKAMGVKEKSWWKGATEGGFWGAIGATLKKLFDKLTDLAERIGKWFSKQFGGEEKTKTEKEKLAPFPTSPIAGTEKFVMRDSTQGGVDLVADSSGKQVVSVGPEGGKIVEKDATQGRIVIQHGKTRIVYTGLTLDSGLATKVGTEIKKGAKLGTMRTDTLNFQILDEQGQQVPQTQIRELLASYAKPAETGTQTQTAQAQTAETQTNTPPATPGETAAAGTPAETGDAATTQTAQ